MCRCMQSARLEDYSPELWALTGSKGAAVMNMLRYVVGDEKFFADPEDLRAAERLEVGQHRRFQEGRGDGLRAGPGLLLHPVDRIERRAGVQAGVHDFPHAEGLPRDGQDLAGPGHVPHAGGPADRDRRQSRREAHRGGGDGVGVLGGHVRQAEEGRHRPEQSRAALQQRHARGGGDPAAASSSPN